jgi:hypothetical protein
MVVAFEEKVNMFTKGNEIKKVYTYYKKYGEEDDYNTFSNKAFRLRLESVLNKFSATKKMTHHMHNLMKENAKNKYLDVEIEADLDDITYDS